PSGRHAAHVVPRTQKASSCGFRAFASPRLAFASPKFSEQAEARRGKGEVLKRYSSTTTPPTICTFFVATYVGAPMAIEPPTPQSGARREIRTCPVGRRRTSI